LTQYRGVSDNIRHFWQHIGKIPAISVISHEQLYTYEIDWDAITGKLKTMGGNVEGTAEHRVRWIRYFMDSVKRGRIEEVQGSDLSEFCDKLEGLGNRPEWQVRQARWAVEWYFSRLPANGQLGWSWAGNYSRQGK
jgi:hypothetical protein